MSTPKLSVFMIVKDEEKNLQRALNSVKWADEIVIVDSGSRDLTHQIARRFTDKVYTREFTNYGDQKNYAITKTSGEWLLSLDADEELTEPLSKAIREVFSNENKYAAYRVLRRSQIFGRWFRFTGTQDDRPVRLFRKGKARFIQPVHEKMEVDGPVGRLDGMMNHYTYHSGRDYVERFNRYTSMEAQDLASRGVRCGFAELILKPIALFFRLYIWKQGFRDGEEGLMFSWLSATYAFAKHAKQLEIQNGR